MDGGEYHHFGLDTAGGLFRPLDNSQDFLMKIKFLAQASLVFRTNCEKVFRKASCKGVTTEKRTQVTAPAL